MAIAINHIHIPFYSFKLFPHVMAPFVSLLIATCEVGNANIILPVLSWKNWGIDKKFALIKWRGCTKHRYFFIYAFSLSTNSFVLPLPKTYSYFFSCTSLSNTVLVCFLFLRLIPDQRLIGKERFYLANMP